MLVKYTFGPNLDVLRASNLLISLNMNMQASNHESALVSVERRCSNHNVRESNRQSTCGLLDEETARVKKL